MSSEYSVDCSFLARNSLRLIRPFDFRGGRKVRVGRSFDGGYAMIDDFSDIDAAYSLGINDDVSWDLDIAQMGIDIYQYDHTIDSLPLQNERFHWSKIGIADRSEGMMRSIPDLIAANGHEKSKNLLLKCDIECAEWDVLYGLSAATMAQFRQIVIEVHDLHLLGDPVGASKCRQALVNLTRHHAVVHVHANNYGGHRMIGGLMIPNVVELTLLRRDAGVFEPSVLTFPTDMDMPCNKDWADIYLGSFVYP